MITYSYQIDRLICNQTLPETPDFVESIQVSITGVDDADGISSNLTTLLQYQPGETFVPYDQLTESTVLGWIESHPAISTYHSSIAEMISLNRNPPYIDRVPPWAAPVQPPEPVSPVQPPPLVFATIGNISL